MIEREFKQLGQDIELIIHTAAQPSHDWVAKEPHTDFTVNANGTLNLLEATRKFCPEATFIFTSTNKVYGDSPNLLPLVEGESRWEVSEEHPFSEQARQSAVLHLDLHTLLRFSLVSCVRASACSTAVALALA